MRSVQRGFTLVELMVVIAIAAILMSIALPSFRGTIRSNRLATASNELISAVALARSEAIRSTRPAIVCPSSTGVSCSADWNQGLLVWVDLNGNAVPGADELVRFIQPKSSLTLSANLTEVAFNGRGVVAGGVSPAFVLQPEGAQCMSGELLVYRLDFNVSGQVSTEKGACP